MVICLSRVLTEENLLGDEPSLHQIRIKPGPGRGANKFSIDERLGGVRQIWRRLYSQEANAESVSEARDWQRVLITGAGTKRGEGCSLVPGGGCLLTTHFI